MSVCDESGNKVNGRKHPSARLVRWLIAVAIVGWAMALYAGLGCVRQARETRFRIYTAIGRNESEVTRDVGPPALMITSLDELPQSVSKRYRLPSRAVEERAMVYYEFGHVILLYLNSSGYVEAVYWGPRR